MALLTCFAMGGLRFWARKRVVNGAFHLFARRSMALLGR